MSAADGGIKEKLPGAVFGKRRRGAILLLGQKENFYPFTAPMVMPFTKYFWKKG